MSVLSPDIIVLDEPSSNLDSGAIEKLKDILAQWKAQGKTIVIAEHRLYFLRELADRMLIMENGRIIRELSADEIKSLTAHPMALSGGQKQRTAIASGIASSKPIIIFDEPTSGLDLAHMKQVADQLKRLKDMGKTVLVVTHDNEFILACCDHVVRLENGSAAENCPLY